MIRGLEDYLARHPFFEDLPPDVVTVLADCASNVAFRADQMVCREGEPADAFYLVRHGRIAVQVQVPGSGARVLDTADEGDVVGWSWIVPPYRWFFDARATEPTRAFRFDATCLRGTCEADPAVGYAFMGRVAHLMLERLVAARMHVLDLYGGTP